jgi:hypothetical protein
LAFALALALLLFGLSCPGLAWLGLAWNLFQVALNCKALSP